MIELYYINIVEIDSSVYYKYYNQLHETDKTKLNNFYNNNDKQLFLSSKILQNYIIKKYKVKNEIKYNKFGKPVINGIKYNVSHDGNICIIAVNIVHEIGIDILKINRNVNLDIISEYFSKRELFQMKENNDVLLFWTLKESYIKMLGKGIHYDINKLEFFVDNNIKLCINNSEIKNVYFHTLCFNNNLINSFNYNNHDLKNIEYFISISYASKTQLDFSINKIMI